MRFTGLFSLLSIAAVAVAQDVTIEVGLGGLKFTPANVTAKEGSVITFKFNGSPGNHSVTQSSFDTPCDPLSGGFDSGTVFIPQNTTQGFPTWNLTVTNATSPIWFFCQTGPHCSEGMVGAINPPSTGNTYEQFLSKAETFSGTPPQHTGALSGVGAVATSPPGPLSGSITGYGLPSTSTSSGSGTATGSGSKPSSSGSAAAVSAGVGSVVLSALLGVVALI